jgi:hypothetical protein
MVGTSLTAKTRSSTHRPGRRPALLHAGSNSTPKLGMAGRRVGNRDDQAPVYPTLMEELLPAAWHRTDRYANNRVEADHGRLKARLRPMRGLKQDRSARVVIAGHGFIQNVRRDTTSWPLRSQRAGVWRLRSTS